MSELDEDATSNVVELVPAPRDESVHEQPAVVVKLVTMPERAAAEDAAYREQVQVEAIAILEKALALVRDKRVAGVTVSLVFEDGCFGWVTPDLTTNLSGLIGAVSSTLNELHKRGDSPGEL